MYRKYHFFDLVRFLTFTPKPYTSLAVIKVSNDSGISFIPISDLILSSKVSFLYSLKISDLGRYLGILLLNATRPSIGMARSQEAGNNRPNANRPE